MRKKKSFKDEPLKTMFSVEDGNEIQQESINKIEECAKNLICASISDIKCILCKQKKRFNSSKENCENENIKKPNKCDNCDLIMKRVVTSNNHVCGFSCHKRGKTVVIKPTEGHGRPDGSKETRKLIIPYVDLTTHSFQATELCSYLQ